MLNKFYNSSFGFFFKKIFLSKDITIKIFTFKNKKLLILKTKINSYYFLYPSFLDIIYINNYLYLTIKQNSRSLIKFKILYFFLVQLTACIKQLVQLSSITFLIRGVGLKVNFLNPLTLSLKLGYSHLISLLIPAGVTISIFKKKIILSSFNKIILGNLGNIIYKYRPINVFTGKGLLKKKKKKFKLKEYTKKI